MNTIHMTAPALNAPAPSAHFVSRRGYGYAGALSDEQLQKAAPSIFADSAHASRSQRYAYIPTSEMVAGMRKAGFLPVKVVQTVSRNEDKRGHAKHLIRFRREDQLSAPEAREVIITNSHDGSSAFHLDAGIFRLACSNGLIVGHADTSYKVRHSGDAQGEVIDCAFRIVDQFDEVTQSIEQMKAIQMPKPLALAFANSAIAARFDQEEKPVTPEQVLRPRRMDDRAGDLWTLFNVVQENVIRGGLVGHGRDAVGREVQRRTREVKGIDQNTALNRALWRLAEEVAKIAA